MRLNSRPKLRRVSMCAPSVMPPEESSFGVDKRALVLVKLVDGKWKLVQ